MNQYSVYNTKHNLNLDEMALYDHVMDRDRKRHMWGRKNRRDVILPYDDRENRQMDHKKNYGKKYTSRMLTTLLIIMILAFLGYWIMKKMKKNKNVYSMQLDTTPNFGPDVNVRPMFRSF